MALAMLGCECGISDTADKARTLMEFEAVRQGCPALHKIIIPDDIWDSYKLFCESKPDQAFHAPIAFLAFKRRYLAAFTSPIHAFCLDDGETKATLTNQYRSDLAERWIFGDDAKKRFQNTRLYQGRLAELLAAQWLKYEGWELDALEAHGANIDIEARSTDGSPCSFEVKHLGQEEMLFELGVQALQSNGVSVGSIPVYSPVDYLLYRIYEAARQLCGVATHRIVVAILSDFDVYYKHPFEEGWIDWNAPRFLRQDGCIDAFLDEKYAANPDLDGDIGRAISNLHEIWFFDKKCPFTLRRRKVERLTQ